MIVTTAFRTRDVNRKGCTTWKEGFTFLYPNVNDCTEKSC